MSLNACGQKRERRELLAARETIRQAADEVLSSYMRQASREYLVKKGGEDLWGDLQGIWPESGPGYLAAVVTRCKQWGVVVPGNVVRALENVMAGQETLRQHIERNYKELES